MGRETTGDTGVVGLGTNPSNQARNATAKKGNIIFLSFHNDYFSFPWCCLRVLLAPGSLRQPLDTANREGTRRQGYIPVPYPVKCKADLKWLTRRSQVCGRRVRNQFSGGPVTRPNSERNTRP